MEDNTDKKSMYIKHTTSPFIREEHKIWCHMYEKI